MSLNKSQLIQQDRDHSWHPFTQMSDWVQEDPVLIDRGQGSYLWDVDGNSYLDANSSIWTNLHGHNNEKLNKSIQFQLEKVAHTSYLGLAHGPGSTLASALAKEAQPELKRVFFSDDGSTSIEAALKMANTAATRIRGDKNPQFLSLNNAYHGDSIGAVSLGQIQSFHSCFKNLVFPVDKVMNPYCYRCPFNKAKHEAGTASHISRSCDFECLDKVDEAIRQKKREGSRYTAMILEPGIQGVAGMVVQPEGYLRKLYDITKSHDMWLIYDEVMTGFGRTGPTFAYQLENVAPDILCLAKGLSGGYLPLAATLTTEEIFGAFAGNYEDQLSFFHGHSYTANQIGCAVAIESLNILKSDHDQNHRNQQSDYLKKALAPLWTLDVVGDIRQLGTIAGIELVKNQKTKEAFNWREKVGIKVCEQLKSYGVLTRPIGNIIVVMLPYSSSESDFRKLSEALFNAITEVIREIK